MKWNSQPRAEFFVEAVSIASPTGELLMCEQVRVEVFQLASFVAGIFCQKALNSGHIVSFSERFNVAMCIAWIVQAVDTILSSCLVPNRASPPRSLTPLASCPNSRSPGFRLLT